MGDTNDGATRAGILGSAMRGASLLVSVQLLSRALTFVLNVALTRHLEDPSLLGVSSVQLYLLYTVVLTLAREGVRRTCLRTAATRSETDDISEAQRSSDPALSKSSSPAEQNLKSSASRTRQDLVNLTWWAVIAGWVGTPLACQWFIWSADPKALETIPLNDYVHSIYIVGLAIAMELLSEPMFVAAQGQLAYGKRSAFEAIAVTARCLSTIYFAVFLHMGLQAFAMGYLAYALALIICYGVHFIREPTVPGNPTSIWELQCLGDLAPSDMLRVRDAGLFRLAASMSFQQIWKLVLAEGEKMVMVTLATDASDQAVYALVFNLGSLIARFVFLPIEETAFAVFGKLNDLALHKKQDENISETLSNAADEDTSDPAVMTPQTLVSLLCRAMTLLGMTFVTFGPSYSHFLISFLYGSRWSEQTAAPEVLGYYCVYVLALAVNGVTEAYVHAVADDATLRRFNGWLFLFSVIYLGSSALLVPYGAPGLILANSINMGMRVAFSVHFITTQQHGQHHELAKHRVNVGDLFPRLESIVAFLTAAAFVHLSSAKVYNRFASWTRAFLHIGVGASLLIGLVVFLGFFAERNFVRTVRKLRAEMQKSKQA